jgi:hypothetical protein
MMSIFVPSSSCRGSSAAGSLLLTDSMTLNDCRTVLRLIVDSGE